MMEVHPQICVEVLPGWRSGVGSPMAWDVNLHPFVGPRPWWFSHAEQRYDGPRLCPDSGSMHQGIAEPGIAFRSGVQHGG